MSKFINGINGALNYRFNKTSISKNAAVFVSVTNLFTLTKYPGNDPETTNDPYSAIGGYFDVSNYPSVKTFSIGLRAGFSFKILFK